MKLKESKNLVWSSTAQQDYYGRMSKEELISEIESDFGNFDEFLVWGGFDSIEDVTEDDIREYYLPSDIDLDYEDFTENIMPMVEKQCNDYNETLVLFGSAANWQGSREACAIIRADEFKNYIYPDYDAYTQIYSDNGALFYTQSSHDTPMGGTVLYLYSFKSDDDYEKASHLCDTEDWEGDFADDAGYKEVGEAIKQGFLTPVRNTFNESLEEGWYQFEYKSGANPYIAKTEKERDKILKKYGKKVTKIKDGFYEIDDKEEKMDSFNFDESLEKNLKEALSRYTFTDGMELTASSEEEVIQKYEDIEKNRNKGKTRPFETLNSIAEDLYKKRDDFSFHYFSDDELALLWGYCCVDIDVPYDDEVYDAISDFPNKREIFAKAKEYAQKNVDFKLGEAYSQSDLMNAVQDAYGYSKKEAKKYIDNADEKTKAELVKGYKDNAKRSFLTDSLKEGNGNVELLYSVAEPLVDALVELEDRGEEVEITWNFGFDRDGNVTAGVDLRPTPRIAKAKKTDELFKIVLPQFEKLMKQYGFVLDDNIKHENPSKNIFGGYHYQIKKVDLDECNIAEAFDLDEARYSDAYDEETRQNGWWYFTTHGYGPGTLPKDVHIIETREGQNEKGTWGDFIKLDGILNTDELKYFDLKELAPSDEEEEEDDFSGFFSDYEFNESFNKTHKNKKLTEADGGNITIETSTSILDMFYPTLYETTNDFFIAPSEMGELDNILIDVSMEFANEAIGEVFPSALLKFEQIVHPKYYNYGGENILFDVTLPRAEYEAVKERAINDPNFAQFLKKNSPRDGYMPYGAYTVEKFKTQDDMYSIGQLVKFYADNDEIASDFDDAVYTELQNRFETYEEFWEDLMGWLKEHEQAYQDFLTHFNADEDDVIDVDSIIDWIYDHDTLAKDFENYFGVSLNESFTNPKGSLSDYVEYLGKRSSSFGFSDDETAKKELKKRFPNISKSDLDKVIKRWHTGKLEEATSNKKFTIKYGKGRPGGDSEVVEFPTSKEAEKYAANHAKGWGFEVTPFDESLNEDKTPYGDTTIEDYVEANFWGDREDKGLFIQYMKKKAVGGDYFNGLNMSNKDWEKEGQKFGLSMKRFPVTESLGLSKENKDRLIKIIDEAKKHSERDNSFDKSLDANLYLMFGTSGMSMHKVVNGKDKAKYVSRWREKSVEDIINELSNQDWEINENLKEDTVKTSDLTESKVQTKKRYKDLAKRGAAGFCTVISIDKANRRFANQPGSFDDEDVVVQYDGAKYPATFTMGEFLSRFIPLREDTVKTSDGKWTNKGEEGTHGKFKTKKEADAQRKAMFANNFHESVNEDYDPSIYEPRQRTALDGKTWWYPYNTKEQKYSTLTKHSKYKTKKECQYAIDHCFDC